MATSLPILFCNCTYANVVPKAVKEQVLRQLSESGIPFDAVPDLCELSARKDPCLAEYTRQPMTIVACYPRAVRWLFSAAGTPLPAEGTSVVNMRTESADAIMAQLVDAPGSVEASS